MKSALRLALPSKGDMEGQTLSFLESCGLAVERPNARQYTATIPALPDLVILFQRAADIAAKVEEGSADLGITGLDQVWESGKEGGNTIVVIEDLGYSRCELVVAVPDTWIDVTCFADLIDLSMELRERGRELRVATKYPRLTQQFFFRKGLNYLTLVESTGAMEIAPTMGYADIIADLTASGTTLRENRLKVIADGTIVRSQACLIANKQNLRQKDHALDVTKAFLELVEACLRATGYYSVTANIRGSSPQAVARHAMSRPELAGIQGPTISRVYSKLSQEKDWYAVTVVVRKDKVLEAVEHLRRIGGNGITVFSANYVFEGESEAYRQLLEKLGVGPPPQGKEKPRGQRLAHPE